MLRILNKFNRGSIDFVSGYGMCIATFSFIFKNCQLGKSHLSDENYQLGKSHLSGKNCQLGKSHLSGKR